MYSHCSLSRLVLVTFFVLCFFAGDSSAMRPGFIYTRHRGRCTPQYWSSQREAWPRMVPERSTVEKMFGVMVAKERWRSNLTLLESTARNDEEGNAYGALLKQGIAALVNSYARKSFSYAPWEVKTMLIQAMVSEPAARRQAEQFAVANDIVKDELRGKPSRKKLLEYTPPPPFTGERSTRTEMVVTPTKESQWQKKWESVREKMQSYPVFKRISGMSEPVVNKRQEIAEDVREIWETSDNPIVHKIQESFSLPDFAAEVEEAIRPVLNAYSEGDVETLKKYCSKEVIERCKAELTAYQSHGFFSDNKLLHTSEVEIKETKMMGTSPDTIHTVYYDWAMQQVEAAELGEDAIYPIWRLREMRRNGVQALI